MMLHMLLIFLALGSLLGSCKADWPSNVYMLPNQTVPVYALVQTGSIYQLVATSWGLTFTTGANYSLVYGNSTFSVQATTGLVSIAASLPSTPANYQLVIQVNDGLNLIAYAPLWIQVLTYSSTLPSFNNLPNYPVTGFMSMVPQSALSGTLLYTLSAQQLSTYQFTANSTFVESLVTSGAAGQRFTVSSTGQVRTAGNYFTSGSTSYLIGMNATNTVAAYPTNSYANPMQVQIASLSPIQFPVSPYYYFKVYERSVVAQTIGTVNAFVYTFSNSLTAVSNPSLLNSAWSSVLNGIPLAAQSNLITYSLTPINLQSSTATTRFGSGTQSLVTQTSPSYTGENTRLAKYTATATVSSSSAASAWQTAATGSSVSLSIPVMVEVIDVNDYAPIFEQTLYVSQGISVNTVSGTTVLTVPVYELDANANAFVQFSIVSTTLSANGVLLSTIPFTVQLSQLGPGGVPGVTTPMSNYTYTPGLCGNTAVASIIVNGNLFYEVNSQHAYSFQLIATDGGLPPQSSSTNVLITLTNANRYPPVFVNRSPIIFYQSLYLNAATYLPSASGSVTAPTAGQQPIGQVQAIDPDGCSVSYSFLVNSLSAYIAQTYFYISQTGLIYLLSAPPDSGSTHLWTLTVQAVDDGQCHNCPACSGASCVTQSSVANITVKQMQLINNRPVISGGCPYVSVREQAGVGIPVTTIQATDTDWNDNGILTYSLVQPSSTSSSSSSLRFQINAQTGAIYTLRSLDRLTDPSYLYLTVFVRDAGIGGSLSTYCVFRVIVEDINNLLPVFDLPAGVSGNSPVNFIPFTSSQGSAVVRVFAYDADQGANGQVLYSFNSVQVSQQVGTNTVTFNLQNAFTINSGTGWVTVAASNLTAALISSGAQYPSSGIAFVQLTVQASNPPAATFYQSSGVFSAAQPVANPNWPTMTFTVALIDTVVAFPNFVQASFLASTPVDGAQLSINENAAVGSLLYTINGTSLCPAIVSSCPTFGINLVTGLTDVSNPQTNQQFSCNGFSTAPLQTTGLLSYLLSQTYYLQIVGSPVSNVAVPNVATANGYLQVNVNEMNIQTPQFYGTDSRNIYSINVTEQTVASSALITVSALIQSTNNVSTTMAYSTIQSGSSNPTGFSLGSSSGVLTSTFTFQRTAPAVNGVGAPPYYFLITAYNNNLNQKSATASVSISVLNLNLNAAVFSPASTSITIPMNLALNGTVYQMSAQNVDGNDPLEYAIISGNVNNAFSVQPDSGLIVLARGLDQVASLAGFGSSTSTFLLTTLVCQVNTGRFVSTFSLAINVQPMNMYPPSFASSNVTVTGIVAGTAPQTITSLSATPYASSANGATLTFSLVNASSAFTLTQSGSSATLSLNTALSRSVPRGHQNWLVLVAVSDSGSPLGPAQTGYCQVTVQLTSGAYNTPVLNPFQNATIYELLQSGTPVTFNFGSSLQVVSNLPNTASMPTPTFSLTSTSQFQLDAAGAGYLSSTVSFNYATVVQNYPGAMIPVPLQVSLTGAADSSTQSTFYVQVLDVNNNVPSFPTSSASITIPQTSPIGTVVYSIQASDADVVDQGALTFTLSGPSSASFISLVSYSVTNTAALVVSSNIAFDITSFNHAGMPFVFTITVYDTVPPSGTGQVRHSATTTVSITVADSNNNAPQFSPSGTQTATLYDSTITGFPFATFSVSDADWSAPNNYIQAYIDRQSDPFGFFALQAGTSSSTSSSGMLYTTTSPLVFSVIVNDDMQQLRLQTVANTTNPAFATGTVTLTLVATDFGSPQLVTRTSVEITLQPSSTAVPQFMYQYAPVAMENQAASSSSPVVTTLPGFGNSSMFATIGSGSYSFTLLTAPNNAQSLFTLCCTSSGGYGSVTTGVSTQLYATAKLSRQQQISYALPILISDTVLLTSSTATITVTVGDADNNPPAAATKTMLLNIYNGAYRYSATSGYYAGYVWNNDTDWWDRGVGNYRFSFVSPAPSSALFSLNSVSGALTVLGAGAGSYTLQFNVQDLGYTGQPTVTSTVQLQINMIPLDAFTQYGSVRIGGLTPEQFATLQLSITNVPYNSTTLMQAFVNQVAQILGANVANVYILNVYSSGNGAVVDPTYSPAIDVLYGVSGSPFHYGTVLNSAMQQNTGAFNSLLNSYQPGASVLMAPIDLCTIPTVPMPCGAGVCSTVLDAPFLSNSPLYAPYTYTFYTNATQYGWANMVESNATAVSFINARLRRSCNSCSPQQFNSAGGCAPDRCSFHGSCSVISPASASYACSCSGPQFDGPRCQQTKHTFYGSGAYAWYPPLLDCSNLTISFSFATTQTTAMLFYSGPFNLQSGKSADFLSVFMSQVNSQTTLTLVAFFGDQTYALQVVPTQTVTDGNWHRIDVYRDQQTIRLIVDQCIYVTPFPVESSTIIASLSGCAAVYSISFGNAWTLDVQSYPVQLGGLFPANYPTAISTINSFSQQLSSIGGLNGCMKNLRINGVLYDLYQGTLGQHANDADGCARESCSSCTGSSTCINTIDSPTSTPQCYCKSGFKQNCTVPSTLGDYQNQSTTSGTFTQYTLNVPSTVAASSLLNMFTLYIQFTTVQPSGVLFAVYGQQGLAGATWKWLILRIVNGVLSLQYNFGSSSVGQWLLLSNVYVSDGVAHNVTLVRSFNMFELMLDDGDGVHYNITYGGPADTYYYLQINQAAVMCGAPLGFSGQPYTNGDQFIGCLSDVRFYFVPSQQGVYQQYPYLTSTAGSDPESLAGSIVTSNQVAAGCANTTSNAPLCGTATAPSCVSPLVCINVWRSAVCGCPSGQFLNVGGTTATCQLANPCLANLCQNGATCTWTAGSNISCTCPAGYSGTYCQILPFGAQPAIASEGIITVAICAGVALIILIVALLILACKTTKPVESDPEALGVVNPAYDTRENLRDDADEQEGAEPIDSHQFDMNMIKSELNRMKGNAYAVPYQPRIDAPDNEAQLGAVPNVYSELPPPANSTPTGDEHFAFAHEGAGSDVGTLSSLASVDTDASLDMHTQFRQLGQNFEPLAQLYKNQ